MNSGFDIEDILSFFARLTTFLLVIPIHESAHALVACKLGDDTAEKQGRISLNPAVHFDLFGTMLMLFTGFGWAKPVPVNPSNFKQKRDGKGVSVRGGLALTALAGPASNIIAAFAAGLFYNLILCTEKGAIAYAQIDAGSIVIGDKDYFFLQAVLLLLSYLFSVNVGLAVFNLIPIPPLDGFNIVRYFTSEKVDMWFYRNQQTITRVFFGILFIMAMVPYIPNPIGTVSSYVSDFLWKTVSWIPQLRWQ